MSKLEQLINELCPDGVEYKTLEQEGVFYGGLTGKSKKDFENGNSKFISYMNVFSNPALKIDVTEKVFVGDNEKQNCIEYGDILFTGSSETLNESGMSSVLLEKTNEKLYLNSFSFGYRLNNLSNYDLVYLKHLFRSSYMRSQIIKTANGVTRFNVSKSKLAKVKMPVPPIEVQREIGKTLDNFTELTEELTTELTEELTARKRQYEYYRDYLLSFDDEDVEKVIPDIDCSKVEYKKLSDVTDSISSGKCKEKSNNGKYIVYGSTGVIAYTDSYQYKGNKILIARVGANAGFVHIATGKYDVSDNTLMVNIKEQYNQKYFYYLLVNMNLNRFAKGGGQPLITSGQLKEILVPVPPLEVQNNIVKILDRFDMLCNGISEDIPAEIEARKQQYEYYRDTLLSFNQEQCSQIVNVERERERERESKTQ